MVIREGRIIFVGLSNASLSTALKMLAGDGMCDSFESSVGHCFDLYFASFRQH